MSRFRLDKFDFEMEDYLDEQGRFPSAKYLDYLNMLLVEDAARWSEKDSDARRILTGRKVCPYPYYHASKRTPPAGHDILLLQYLLLW